MTEATFQEPTEVQEAATSDVEAKAVSDIEADREADEAEATGAESDE